ncbi:hypothetical protein [Streptomyces sp. NPDC050738]|uniref:hypothetical protein n=1 Tax=Streptomyces sp. NPDC050738 TaxID=3154744 RepID=UPI0034209AC0
MDFDLAFEGLDSVPWAGVGEPDMPDMPDILRSLASPDPVDSEAAIFGLSDRVLNQGTVFPATIPAVPFIARLACAGVFAPTLLGLLGYIADADSEVDIAQGAARLAVRQQYPLLVSQLAAPDAGVRQYALWAVAKSGPAQEVADALMARWSIEQEPSVRADLLYAVAAVSPESARLLASSSLSHTEPDKVRIAAVVAGLDSGLPWTAEAAKTLTALLPATDRRGETPWLPDPPLSEVVRRLASRGESHFGVDLVMRALNGPAMHEPKAVREAVMAAKALGQISPESRRQLLLGLEPLRSDPQSGGRVQRIIRSWRHPM